MRRRRTANSSKTAQKQDIAPDAPHEPVPSTTDGEPTPSVTELITDAIAEAPHAGQFISKVRGFQKLILHP